MIPRDRLARRWEAYVVIENRHWLAYMRSRMLWGDDKNVTRYRRKTWQIWNHITQRTGRLLFRPWGIHDVKVAHDEPRATN